MSWFKDKKGPGFFTSFCYKVVKAGNVPKHVAFIMDGNRRYARKIHVDRAEGHSHGFNKLTEALHWCFELGIPEVTVYAFSIENFKRSEDEINALMNLAKEKFERLMEEREMIMKHGVCVRIIGDLSLLPKDVQIAAAKVIDFSKNNSRSILNVAMAYTSRHEITEAVKEMAVGVKERVLKVSDINEQLLEKSLYTSKCRDVDILIRTSGEIRLSDFLLWQTSHSLLSFVDVYWPEFTLWQFFYVILQYQLGYNTLQNIRELAKLRQEREQMDMDLKSAYKELLEKCKDKNISNPKGSITKESLDEQSTKCCHERKQRTQEFLDSLENKRMNYISSLLADNDK